MRNTKIVQIDKPGRDLGKVFVLTEMPATVAEKWAVRAFLAMARSGVEIPDELAGSGIAGLMSLGLQALSGITWSDAEPLLDEMLRCVRIRPDPRNDDVIRALVDRGTDGDDIEEISTRLFLRKEVWALHTGFLEAVETPE